ncbi:MAG TPA: DNA-binding domain-containing protein [bacterium]|nr:DNA-binding domain-containing protein [bacterium]
MLKVSAVQNHFPDASKPYVAHTSYKEIIDFDGLVDRMATGRTTISKPDLAGTFALLSEELHKALAEGYMVKMSFGSLYLSASGTFDRIDEPFSYGQEGSNHDLRLHFRANRAEEINIARDARIQRELYQDKTGPVVFSATSIQTEEELVATQGDFFRIEGSHLKFDKSNAELGVWFKNGQEHRSALYAAINAGAVIAQVPQDLEPGQYTLIVRTSPHDKDIKESRLQAPVSIV